MRGSNGRGEKNVSQMKSENRRRVNEMEKDKKTNVSEEDVEWKVSVGGSLMQGLPPQPWLHEYLFIFALFSVQLQPKVRSASY